MEGLELKIPIKYPKNKSLNEIKKYFISQKLKFLVQQSNNVKSKKDMRFDKTVYKPDLIDLYRLHQFIILNKRLNVLEYGTGWSSLVILHALKVNELKLKKKARTLRFKKKFSLTVIDNEKKYLKKSKDRIDKFFKNQKKNISFHYSHNIMTTYNRRVCSYFNNHPTINPDFIYLDGPDQFKIKKRINNITIADYEMMPMNVDILKYENFLTPGTIILSDGRTANTRFLINNFQRKWLYKEDKINDQNIFLLNEKFFGKINKEQLKFYNEK